MRPRSLLFVALSIAAAAGAALPEPADAAARQRTRAAPARKPPRPLDLSLHGPSVAMEAARAAQAAALPGAPAAAGAVVETATAGSTVSGVTVSPEVRRPGRVVASTNATSLRSPNFSAADAAPPPLAVAIGPNTALGRQTVDNTPPATAGGLLGANPDLVGLPTRGQVGVTNVF